PDGFARVAERQDEESGAPVLARLRVAHHRPIAVIDLAFFAGCRRDHDARLRRGRAAEGQDKAPHARIASREAVIVDEVLPDRHGVASAAERLGDLLSIGLARARTRRTGRDAASAPRRSTPPSWWPLSPHRRRETARRKWPDWPIRVGGHHGGGNGRFRP